MVCLLCSPSEIDHFLKASDSDNATDQEVADPKPVQSVTQFAAKILVDNPCSKKAHTGPCIDVGDAHYQLRPQTVTLWAQLCVRIFFKLLSYF